MKVPVRRRTLCERRHSCCYPFAGRLPQVIAAERTLAASPQALYDYLAGLERHWHLLPGVVEVVVLEDDAALVRLRGPLGVRRTIRTEVTGRRPPRVLAGRAGTARGTAATVTWTLTPRDGATHVRLAADVERVAPLDRVLLAAGGRLWLRRRFADALARLAALVG